MMLTAWVLILGAAFPLGVLMMVDAKAQTIDTRVVVQRRSRGDISSQLHSGAGSGFATTGAGCGTAIAVFALSGWLGPAIVIGFMAFAGSRGVIKARRERGSDLARIEALAGWVENLRDVLSAGDQPLGAIAATVATCPHPIRQEVRRLAAGLSRQDPDLVLRRFADDLNDPIGDLVAAGLLIAIRQGARTVGVLSALAEQARSHADRRRIIESERAPARREVQLLTVIMGLLVAGLLVMGRSEYLKAYETASGQVFLSAALLGFGALILRVQQLARFARPSRFLTAGGPRPITAAPADTHHWQSGTTTDPLIGGRR
jgi:Flp pilus assembly protein TadB